MISEKEFHEILEKKGVIKECRKRWWRDWEEYQKEFGGSKELLESSISAVIKKGCKASCYL